MPSEKSRRRKVWGRMKAVLISKHSDHTHQDAEAAKKLAAPPRQSAEPPEEPSRAANSNRGQTNPTIAKEPPTVETPAEVEVAIPATEVVPQGMDADADAGAPEAAVRIQAIWRGKRVREHTEIDESCSSPRPTFLRSTVVGVLPAFLLGDGAARAISSGLLSLEFACTLVAFASLLLALWPFLAPHVASFCSAFAGRVRRAINPPLQIPILETAWCAERVQGMADDAVAAYSAHVNGFYSPSKLGGAPSESEIEDSLAEGLVACATRIQAHWRGRADRERAGSFAMSEYSESERSESELSQASSRKLSPRARAKWKRAIKTTSKLNDIVAHWLNWVIPPSEQARIAKLPNKNMPSHFLWLHSLLTKIARLVPPPAPDQKGERDGTPLFVVAGACPSSFAGMQAVVYVAMQPSAAGAPHAAGGGAASGRGEMPEVDFWWIKPRGGTRSLEPDTLPRNTHGPHKNTPGGSAAVYAPLAKLFMSDGQPGLPIRFSMERCSRPDGPECWRATLHAEKEPGVTRYLCLVWQESWASPLAYHKWIQGKLLYQKEPLGRFYACPYRIDGKAVSVNLALEQEVISVLPPNTFKLDCDC